MDFEVASSGGWLEGRPDPRIERLLRTPPTKLTRPRLLSRWCATVDRLVVACGFAVMALALVSAVWTWRDDQILIAPGTLEAMLGWLIVPGWIWMTGSMIALNGLSREQAKRTLPMCISTSVKVALAFAAIVLAGTIIRSWGLGATEGTARHPAPGIYQVDPETSHPTGWLTVSEAEYQRWSARFVRAQIPLAMFGLALAGFGLNVLGWHRQALDAENASDLRMDPQVRGRGCGGP